MIRLIRMNAVSHISNCQQIIGLDAKYNNNRNTAPHLKTLYLRRRSQLLREKVNREQYFEMRSRLLSVKYPTVVTPSDFRPTSRSGSLHSRTCSMESLDIIPPPQPQQLTPQSIRIKTPNLGSISRRSNTPRSSLGGGGHTTVSEKDTYAFTYMPHIFDQHAKSVYLVLFAHNSNNLLACCSVDHTISLCTLNPYVVKNTLVGHEGSVRDIDWSIDNSLLLSAAEDGTARLWLVEDGKCIRVVRHVSPLLRSARFLPMNNNTCVVGCNEGVLQGYNLSTGKPLTGAKERIGSSITCVVFGTDTSILWVSNNKGKIFSVNVNPLSCQMKKLRSNSIPGMEETWR